MSHSWGIEAEYLDITGQTHHIDPATIRTLRGLIGQAPEPNAAPLFARPGTRWPSAAVIELEDGGRLPSTAAPPEGIQLGYHRLHPDQGAGREPNVESTDRIRRRLSTATGPDPQATAEQAVPAPGGRVALPITDSHSGRCAGRIRVAQHPRSRQTPELVPGVADGS